MGRSPIPVSVQKDLLLGQAISRWGVELSGEEEDKKAWSRLLLPPFDPFVELVRDVRGDIFVLRSRTFDGKASANEVKVAAKDLLRTLNVAMLKTTEAGALLSVSVVEFLPDLPPRKHVFVELESGSFRYRGGILEVAAFDAQGNLIQLSAQPSRAQLWMRAASLSPNVKLAISYLEDKPNWFELYKAYEVLQNMPTSKPSNPQIRRFRQTANAESRHPHGKVIPHEFPMDLAEASAFITQWMTVAVGETLAKYDKG